METFPPTRCLPRRPVICFAFICMMFIACAFYTLFTDSRNTDLPPLKYLDASDFEGAFSIPPKDGVYQSSSSKSQLRDAAATATQPPQAPEKATSGTTNKLAHASSRTSNSVQVTTKYTHLKNASVSSSTVSVNRFTTTVSTPTDTCSLTMEDPKLILLWTPFFSYWHYFPKEYFRKCPRCRNCKVTTDRSKLLESDAVIFHARDMSIIDMPPRRLPHQRWIFYCLESPPYSDFPGLQHTQNMFNWTMTYRADSDIPSPYGYISKVRPPRPMDMQNLEWAWANKTKSVVWMSSHCPTHGGRDLFAAELRKYIDVDVYGTCGESVCPEGQTDKCLLEFAQTYKFFLAFENTLCKDYMTEKFYRTLKYDIVPVVFGGAKYGKFSPPGSFIDALSFKSPKHLAFFLSGVGRNFKLYSSFFKWRRDYAVNLGNKKECLLCSMLHNKNLKPSSYENLREWWVKGSHCKTWKPKR